MDLIVFVLLLCLVVDIVLGIWLYYSEKFRRIHHKELEKFKAIQGECDKLERLGNSKYYYEYAIDNIREILEQ